MNTRRSFILAGALSACAAWLGLGRKPDAEAIRRAKIDAAYREATYEVVGLHCRFYQFDEISNRLASDKYLQRFEGFTYEPRASLPHERGA